MKEVQKLTYNSNSWSIRASGDNRVSGVVTKWMPLFNVHVSAVACCGMGTLRPFTPSTEENGIRKWPWKEEQIPASNKDLTVCLPWFFLRPVLPNLLSILVLLPLEYSVDNTNIERTMSEGRLTAFHALPLFTSPANDVCETCSASAEAKIASCSWTRYFCHPKCIQQDHLLHSSRRTYALTVLGVKPSQFLRYAISQKFLFSVRNSNIKK